ncbi:hypothetical protein QJS04_geneDACA024623 [Acorus gramineus]|uniref:Reverse transcriptase zinc-binding domain-containing protein n=1 Tax=Acorus gramineus TaxID=55184 RepID=A0AAV8ZWV9_ACOGR|nr:hypothetical protein QJS04_geneDACA024623 [Acorus gramineus]
MLCLLCALEVETADHLFCACEAIRPFWLRLKEWGIIRTNFLCIEELWYAAKSVRRRADKSIEAELSWVIIPAGMWAIWLSRNATVFGGQRFYLDNLWELVVRCIQDWGRALTGRVTSQWRPRDYISRGSRSVFWVGGFTQVGNVGANQQSLGRVGFKCWIGEQLSTRPVQSIKSEVSKYVDITDEAGSSKDRIQLVRLTLN